MKIKLLVVLLMSSVLLGCSCTREQLGISELEWSSYSKNKRQVLLDKCKQFYSERKNILQRYKRDRDSGEYLAVKIFDGKVMFPPAFVGWHKYRSVAFSIVKGECLEIELSDLANASTKTRLGVCYADNKLYLDPSCHNLAKKMGTVNIPYSPLWNKGFLYKKINSAGYVKFNDVMIRIKQQKVVKDK